MSKHKASLTKGPTWAQIGEDFRAGALGPNAIEARPYSYSGPYPKPAGHTEVDITCPFCRGALSSRLWSLEGAGKRCSCGALFGGIAKANPTAYHWSDETIRNKIRSPE